jgi:DNA polymerase-3 subunit gamma/tau
LPTGASRPKRTVETPPWEDEVDADTSSGIESEADGPARPPRMLEPASFVDVVRLVGDKRDAKLRLVLEDHVSLVRFEPGRIELHLLPGALPGLVAELAEKLFRWTGKRWSVVAARERGEPPIGEVRRAQDAAERAEIEAHPAVQAVLKAFPKAGIKDIRAIDAPADEADDEDGRA